MQEWAAAAALDAANQNISAVDKQLEKLAEIGNM